MTELAQQHCISPKQGLQALDGAEVEQQLERLEGWAFERDKPAITREFRFNDFYQTIAFVNAIAWIANQQDHHPDLEVGYNRCRVHYTTHAVDGVSMNDVICAARIDALNR